MCVVLLIIISDIHIKHVSLVFTLQQTLLYENKEVRFHCLQVTLHLSDTVKLFSCVSNSYTGWTRITVGSPYTVVVNAERVT
jgi:uncharacterized membrane protein SirB2